MAAAPVPEITGEIAGISPNTLYYLALYVLVFIVRFFKLRKQPEWTKKQIFHVALEIVYTSSGLVILLLQDLKAYQAFIIVAYLILVLVSSQIESMEDKFSPNGVFGTHLGIVAAVVIVTVWFFESVQPAAVLRSKAAHAADMPDAFRVAIPYEDASLRAHVGFKTFGGRQLVFVTTVDAGSPHRAKELAIETFWKNVMPYKVVEDPRSVLYVQNGLVTVEPVKR